MPGLLSPRGAGGEVKVRPEKRGEPRYNPRQGFHHALAEEFAIPVHDWTRVRSNRFHDFHQSWTIALRNALNAGRLPPGYFAMVEQRAGCPEPDIIIPELNPAPDAEAAGYARKANRLTVRHPDGDVVAVVEIVSPGNKDSRHAIRSFARKAVELLQAGVRLLIWTCSPPVAATPRGCTSSSGTACAKSRLHCRPTSR